MEKYLKENHDHLPPHVFAIADQCYKNLLKKQDQSVIIRLVNYHYHYFFLLLAIIFIYYKVVNQEQEKLKPQN